MTEGRLHATAIVVTLVFHGAIAGGAIWGVELFGGKAPRPEPPPRAIEAGLAIKKKTAEGPKSRMPQRDVVRPPPPPDAVKVARDPETPPDPKPRKPDVPQEVLDYKAAAERARRLAEQHASAAGERGGDDETREGSASGSEFGTLDRMKGDPYVGELIGRMTTNPDMEVPSVVPAGRGLETWGCVKLNAAGKIVDRTVPEEHRSKNATFNRAVAERLKLTTDMEAAVPGHLRADLVGRWVCVPYRF